MGLQQSRQAGAPKVEPAEPAAAPPERYDGLIPRSLTARQACNARRVRRLIRAGRLAPCFEEDLPGAEGEECPVCMEHYRRLNSTACCHQDICTECFICVVAPGGVSSRCPYCQAHALQVYLRPLPCHAAEPEAEAAAAGAVEGCTSEAAANAAPASEAAPRQPAQSSRPPSSMGVSGAGSGSSSSSSSSTARAASTASSGLSMASLDLEGDSVPVTAFLAPAPAAAARAAVRQHQEQARRLACSPGATDSGCSGVVPVSLSLGCDLRLLAEAAANASRADGPAIVAMVRRAGKPDSSGSAPGSSSSAPGGSDPRSGTDPRSSGGSSDHTAPSSSGAAEASAGSEQPGVPAAVPDGLPEQPCMPTEGGPVLLQLPDGSEQLVLLRSAQQEAEEEAAALAAAWERQQQQAADAAAALPSYQPPASQEDELVRRAIAQADASLLQHQPASASPAAGEDWLERMRQADAALRAAVARSDAQHFGGGASDGAAGSGGSEGCD